MGNDAVLKTATDTSSTGTEAATMMTCETCDLVGGPFPAAEAAHLQAIHNRLHHGLLFAA